MKRKIFLNSGHSKSDPGAIVPNSLFKNESELNIAIRDKLTPLLKNQGFEVILIPDELNLKESIAWVNERTNNINNGLALSIHNNCCRGEGAEVYYVGNSPASRKIAKTLVDQFCMETGIKNRGARSDTISRFGQLGWLRRTNCWATLIETGFLDNHTDMNYIIHNLDSVAKGIAKGVCRIYGMEYQKNENREKKALQEIKEVLKRYKI